MVASAATVRVLIGKVGFDPHDRGILVLSQGLRNAGMEVIVTGKFQTAEEVVAAAIQESADVIALSDHCGVMRLIARDVLAELARHGATEICVVAGGVIPRGGKPPPEGLGGPGDPGRGEPRGGGPGDGVRPRTLRVLLVQDSTGHSTGYHVVARGLRDAGHEVILGGALLPREIARLAGEEGADAIGYRIMDAAPAILGGRLAAPP